MKKVFSITLIATMLIWLTGCSLLEKSETSSAIEQGMTALGNGEYKIAAEAFDKALDLGAKDEKIEELYEMITDYLAAQEAYESRDYTTAQHYLEEIDDDYKDYDVFRQDVRDLEEWVNQAIDAEAIAKKTMANPSPNPAPQTPPPAAVAQDGYLFPSHTQYLTVAYLNTLDKHTIDLIRNEIYARHGYIFQTAEFANYFNAQSWYVPSVPAASFDTSVFNAVENANLKLLIEYQGL